MTRNASALAGPDLISVEDLFSSPTKAVATISPDGTRIAYLAPWKNRLNIWVQDIDADESARCVTADETRSVLHYSWTTDSRRLLYLQDSGGDENWHVFRVDLETPDAPAVDLTPFPGAMAAFELLPDRPGKAIVHCNKRDHQQMDVYELDIASGELTMLVQNPGEVVGWLVGRGGELFATAMTTDGDIGISQWDKQSESLRSIAMYDGTDYTMGIYPMVVTPDGTGIWMGSNEGTDHTRLVRLDVTSGKQTAVDKHPTMDIDARSQVWPGLPEPLIQSRATGDLLGVRYLGERQVIHALDPQFADVLAHLEKLSDGDISGLTSDDSGRKWVVSFNHDRNPGATYLYDHGTGQGRLLFRPLPHLNPEELAAMLPVTIPSRDGLDLPSYLTLPPGSEGEGPRPLVLMVHGGPWARDGWMFAPAVQLLANRGYAVCRSTSAVRAVTARPS